MHIRIAQGRDDVVKAFDECSGLAQKKPIKRADVLGLWGGMYARLFSLDPDSGLPRKVKFCVRVCVHVGCMHAEMCV